MNKPTELEIVEDLKLVAYASQTGLEQSTTTPLVSAFSPIFAEARKVLAEATGVAESVKDATCVSEIKKARACRLAIRKVRLSGEAVRKAQKANALAYGKAVDGFYNILDADLAPVEKALQDAEDTAERAEIARKDAIEAGRKTAMAPYVSDVALYAVRDMTNAAFSALLIGVKTAKEQADAATAKAEAERIDREKAEATERERIRQENERLRQEAIAREAASKTEREAAEKKLAEERAESARKQREIEAKAELERKEAAAKAAKERAEAEAKAKAEREKIEASARAEKEAREQAELEAKKLRELAAKQAEEREEIKRKAAAEAKKAAQAPDKQKIMAFAQTVRELKFPVLKTNGSLEAEVSVQIEKFAAWIETKAEKL